MGRELSDGDRSSKAGHTLGDQETDNQHDDEPEQESHLSDTMARLCGTKLSKDARKLQEKRGNFGFTFSGPKKYTRLSPAFVARVPQDDVQAQAEKSVLFEEKTLQ